MTHILAALAQWAINHPTESDIIDDELSQDPIVTTELKKAIKQIMGESG